MKGVWKIATIANIPVQVHWSFGLLFLWVYYEGDRNGLDWEGILIFGLLMLALFGCVVLHEFGHALAARYYGVSTKDITLSPIGGIARLNKLPEKPIQEFVVAVAGPMVNVVIALLIGGLLWLFAPSVLPQVAEEGGPATAFSNRANFFPLLFWLNLALVVFNLLPAFPMDGGRMLRSVLSLKLGRVRATQIASVIGRIIAVGLLGLAIYRTDLVLGLISLFVFIMAAREYYLVRLEDRMSNNTIAAVFRKEFTRLKMTDSIQEAITISEKGEEEYFLVFNANDHLAGILTQHNIASARQQSATTPLSNFTTPVPGIVLLEESVKTVYERMSSLPNPIFPVFDGESLVGVVDLNLIHQFLKDKGR